MLYLLPSIRMKKSLPTHTHTPCLCFVLCFIRSVLSMLFLHHFIFLIFLALIAGQPGKCLLPIDVVFPIHNLVVCVCVWVRCAYIFYRIFKLEQEAIQIQVIYSEFIAKCCNSKKKIWNEYNNFHDERIFVVVRIDVDLYYIRAYYTGKLYQDSNKSPRWWKCCEAANCNFTERNGNVHIFSTSRTFWISKIKFP